MVVVGVDVVGVVVPGVFHLAVPIVVTGGDATVRCDSIDSGKFVV